jgi:hypothetical protein
MDHDESSGGGMSGATLALALGGAALLLLLLCGGAFAFLGLRWAGAAAEREEAARAAEDAHAKAVHGAAEREEALRAAEVARAAARDGGALVTQRRLAGARLVSIGRGKDAVWEFGDQGFTVFVDRGPGGRALLDALLGPGKTATRIDGSWQLSGDGRFLELRFRDPSHAATDRRAAERSARLAIAPAGRLRVNLGGLQYNVFAGAAQPPSN